LKKFFLAAVVMTAMFFQCERSYALTLEEALKEVVVTHPRILEKLKEYNASVNEIDRVTAGFKPTLDASAELGYEDVSNSSTKRASQDSRVRSEQLMARQLLYDGGRTRNDGKARSAAARSSLFGYFDAANQTAYETIEKYIDVIKYMTLVKLSLENVEVHQKLLKSIKERVASGTAGKSELERVQGRLAAAQAVLISRQNDYRREIYNLHKYMGRFVDGEELTVPKIDLTLLPQSLQEAFKCQNENNPTILAAESNITEKKYEYERDLGEFDPTLHLEASRDWRSNYSGVVGNDNGTKVLVKARWNIYDGGAKKARNKKDINIINREKEVYNRVRRSFLNDLQLTWTSYKLLDSQIGALKKSLIFTRQSLKSYKEEFILGQRLLINILDAENEYQTLRAQLASVEFDLMISKFRIMYTTGTLLENLRVDLPLAREFKETKKALPRKNTEDKLPLSDDADLDKIVDKLDISVNSTASSEVDILGENPEMSKKYAQEPLKVDRMEYRATIKDKPELQANKIKAGVATVLEIISFVKGSVELSENSKKIMRELIEQIRALAGEGLIKITVLTSEKSGEDENYALALQRAYNIKKIFVLHSVDPEAVQVFGRGVEKGTVENSLVLKIENDPQNLKNSYDTLSADNVKFEDKKEKLTEGSDKAIAKIAEDIKVNGNPPVEVVVYSNDFENEADNDKISARRAEVIRASLKTAGVPEKKIVPIGWGNYDAGLEIFEGTSEVRARNRVDFVVRK